MDSLSLSASVIAIATLAAQTCSAFSDLRYLCQSLPERLHASRVPILKAHAWRKEQGRLQSLQEDVRTVKANLNLMLGASNSYAYITKYSIMAWRHKYIY